jgi:hypothetical protein
MISTPGAPPGALATKNDTEAENVPGGAATAGRALPFVEAQPYKLRDQSLTTAARRGRLRGARRFNHAFPGAACRGRRSGRR